ncbi:MAG: hypothetical protein CBB75_04640 [bacterium TMED15]|nr:MAG: hypothetical protein CBB75_04640 [bacterium TMED15]
MVFCSISVNVLPKMYSDNKKMEMTGQFWMLRLADDISLSDLNIPGTHNSAARYEPFPQTAKCQSLSLMAQLQAGVRFFDIRCHHKKDLFFIFHGPINQRLSFDQVLAHMISFLIQNNQETLIMSIKEEHVPKQTTRPFTETLHSYINQNATYWYTKQKIPNLGIVRGKIILLRRFFSSNPIGIPATDWQHDGFHQTTNLFIQDQFEIPNASVKWETVETALEYSIQDKSPSRLHLHFASGYIKNRLGIPNITKLSSQINQNLARYLSSTSQHRYGCLIFDFITSDLAKQVYELNFYK